MKWKMTSPSRGDMIRVKVGTIYHFGIYVSDEEIIQFGLAPSRRAMMRDCDVEVLASDIDDFLAGGFLEVCEFDRKEKKKNRTPDEIVSYARSRLGTKGYSILYNNCEHFANECVSGEHISRQADEVRALFRNMPIADVYLAELPDRDIGELPACTMRREDIENVTNPTLRRERYYVWKLLEYGLNRSFGIKIADLEFKKSESGRYYADGVEFSLSHSNGALAVALSRAPIGVDVEALGGEVRVGLAERSMTEDERRVYDALPNSKRSDYFITLWTAKEALFKASHSERFSPVKEDTDLGSFRSYEKSIGGKSYALSVATDTPDRIRIFENIKL